jgi:hypothetical protein
VLISYNKDKKAMWHLQVKLIVEMWHDINSLTCSLKMHQLLSQIFGKPRTGTYTADYLHFLKP